MTRPERLLLAAVVVILSAMAGLIFLILTLSRWHETGVLAADPLPLGATVAQMTAVLKRDTSDDELRDEAANSLILRGREAVPVFVDCLDDESLPIRRIAVSSLKQMASTARTAVPALIARAATEPDAAALADIMVALTHIAPADPQVWKTLEQAISAPGPETQMAAIKSLTRTHPPQIAVLGRTLDHADAVVQLAAAEALGRLGPEAEPALAALVNKVRLPGELAAKSATVLFSIGKPAVPGLVAATQAEEGTPEFVRLASVLSRLDPHEAEQFLPRLLAAIQDSQLDPDLRYITIPGTLRTIGKPAIGPLTPLLTDPDAGVRVAGAISLSRITPGNAAVLPGLIEGLDMPHVATQAQAIDGLNLLGPGAAAAVPKLRQMLAHPNVHLAQEAQWALEKIGASGVAGKP